MLVIAATVVALGMLVWLVLSRPGSETQATAEVVPATAAATPAVATLPPPLIAIETVPPLPSPEPQASLAMATPPTLLPTPTAAAGASPQANPDSAAAEKELPRPPATPVPGQGPRPVLPPISDDLAMPATHGNRDRPYIALTFDACQDPDLPAGFDAALIQVLIDTGTPATLFLGGDWMRTHPEETRFLAAHPQFELGNHGYAHIDFATATLEEMQPEIEQTQQIMWELIGRQPDLFRFPGGTYTQEALAVVASLGVRPIEWEVVSGDPDPDISAERMIPWVVNQVQNGSIIIMHMNGRGWHTAEALPTIIAQLRGEGYEFVTVSQLLGE